ncbi:sensor histidine kinase [Pararhodonellum marinum]|uniref:sensor histidine kinase n=1 Tax=Pararhodonellum marinum TaxID=2755358 RepID=UPI00293BA2BD|nr:ATP-binding protein [Pararhodonellum marinum]
MKQWKFSIEDNPEFANPDFDDSSWPSSNIEGFMDSLSSVMAWDQFVWLRLTIQTDSSFYALPWWIYYYSVSPGEIYLDGKLLTAFGHPSPDSKAEVSPVFYANEPPFVMLPILEKKEKIVLAIRWSAHKTIKISKMFPGTFKEYGPNVVLKSTDFAPTWYDDINQSYLRVFFGAGLLLLVMAIQAFSWWYTGNSLNRGIFFVSLFLLIHLFVSHPHIFGYSVNSILIDTLLFNPLFLLLFMFFPWLASSMLGLPFPLSNQKFIMLIVIALSSLIVTVLFVGTTSWGYWVLYLGIMAISLGWLIQIIVKAYKLKIKYRGIVALTYITPIGIVLLAFTIQVLGNYFNFDLNSFLQENNLFTLLIISVYVAIPVLTTFYIARQNIDLLSNLSFMVKERTYDLEKSLDELKSTQAQLIQSEKMASLGELTSGIAHEIQNPLNFVNNFSEVSSELMEEVKSERLKVEGERDESIEAELLNDVAQNLEKINYHGKRADAIVKSMLEHSKTGSGTKELTDINALAVEYLNLAYQSFKSKNTGIDIELITDFDPSLPKIELVRPEIGKVLLNILNNAFYACTLNSHSTDPSKFDIQNSTFDIQKKPQVTLSTKNSGNAIKISISDTGPGIPDAIKAKVFQPFFTTKPTGQGTGLGLSLSYDIVKAHGGEITLRSEAGNETEFFIKLPVKAPSY